MKKILSSIVIALLVASAGLFAEDNISGSSAGVDITKTGQAGAQFTKIGVGARANAMGGAYGSVANDLSSIHWNPAGLAGIEGLAAEFSYTSWFADFQHNFGAIAFPLSPDYIIALSLVSFGASDIPITTMNSPDGTGATYDVNDYSVQLTFSGFLTDQFKFGVNAKYMQNTFADVAAGGFAFDVGTIYDTGLRGIKLGFSIHNLGTEQEYEGQNLRDTKKFIEAMRASPLDVSYVSYPFSIPIVFRAGISATVIEDGDHELLGAFDFVTTSDAPEQFIVGAEYTWNEFLAFRAGYNLGHDQFGLSGGVGIKYFSGDFGGRLDYSISPTFDIGLINRLSIAIDMGN